LSGWTAWHGISWCRRPRYPTSGSTANDPSRIAFQQMMGVFAQYDKSMVVLKLAGARARKRAREGRCEGRKPFSGTTSARRRPRSGSRPSGKKV
jgi:hypothetical protein